jgi:hypothetical protein
MGTDGQPLMMRRVETRNLGQLREVIMEHRGQHYLQFLTLLQQLQEIHGKQPKHIKILDKFYFETI